MLSALNGQARTRTLRSPTGVGSLAPASGEADLAAPPGLGRFGATCRKSERLAPHTLSGYAKAALRGFFLLAPRALRAGAFGSDSPAPRFTGWILLPLRGGDLATLNGLLGPASGGPGQRARPALLGGASYRFALEVDQLGDRDERHFYFARLGVVVFAPASFVFFVLYKPIYFVLCNPI